MTGRASSGKLTPKNEEVSPCALVSGFKPQPETLNPLTKAQEIDAEE